MPAEKSQRSGLAACPSAPPSSTGPGGNWLAAAGLALAAFAAYCNSFGGPFALDDISSIAGNPSLRHLWPLTGPLTPPAGLGLTVEGRPLLNLSFALNYAISGLKPWSYHATNLLIHLLAGLALCGIVRRTLEKMGWTSLRATVRGVVVVPQLLAFATALLWILHPLQTESVTYVVQRSESLMGLFYLLTLYGFIRGVAATERREESRAWLWWGGSWLACLLGMATKEVMVSAPVIVFLYDRTFIGGSFRAAWQRRGRFHAGLGATWILLAWLVLREGNRGGTSGFEVGVGAAAYWLDQFPAIVRYLRLALWPTPLVFDYGAGSRSDGAHVLPAALAVIALAVIVGWLFFRSPPAGSDAAAPSGSRALGFAGGWFFAILAPTSLVPGNRQTLAEHRMYLALAPLIAVAVTAAARATRREGGAALGARFAGLGIVTAIAAPLFCEMTARRNLDYASELTLFADTAAKRPENPYAQANFGTALLARGQAAAAAGHFEAALRLRPNYPIAENNLGNALLALGRTAEAVEHYGAALRLNPGYADAHNNLGSALIRSGRVPEAAAEFEAALRLQPADAEAHNNLGSVLAIAGRLSEAVAQFQKALQLDPDYLAARRNLDRALRQPRRALNP